ncbi:MAG TPA: amidohydrolase family protein, partial [Saprospiraceae bacterium]|nr:amidohydrolase family protein [Saprospiraceae bacterium]
NVVPDGGTISGTSSVVQLDAWNWEDASYKSDVAMVLRMPSLLNSGVRVGQRGQRNDEDRLAMGLKKVEDIKAFFREAKAYLTTEKPSQTNLKFESLRSLFSGKQKLFVHCSIVKEMLVAIELSKEFGFEITLVGAEDSWQIADVLKTHNISVILNSMHSLPTMIDDDVDQPYKTPAMLQKAGVLFAINDNDEHNRYRNLPFNAGTACAFGLAKEEALQAITLNTAKILGISDITGSVEIGKHANLVVSTGDLLDMRTNDVQAAFIQGRQVDLANKQTHLNEKYKTKYGIK